ncbi:hypothetical protein M9Y10_016488 [Tritrichomonas musculus]|uniref:BAR domain-containing protein n=1 Tax=Tritrichomonas musculus TaxID=1915356 RepID=A0ABR2HWQ8_9EUKA
MWRKMKQNSTAMFEKMKVKKTEESPEFQEAHEHYADMKKCSKDFIEQAESFVNLVSKIIPDFDEVCKNIKPVMDTIDDPKAQEFSKCLDQMDSQLTSNGQDFANKIIDQVIGPMKVLSTQMTELGKVEKEHERMSLLLEANKDKLAKLTQKNKKPKEIEKYQQKVQDKTKTVADLESSFINDVQTHWDNRAVLLQKPLSDLSLLMTEFGAMIRDASMPLQQNIGNELMNKEYQEDAN